MKELSNTIDLFLNNHTLLVADYQEHNKSWKARYEQALQRTGLKLLKFPNVFSKIRNEDGDYTAIGCYIIFAWIGNVILFPQFAIPQDEEALRIARGVFNGYNVILMMNLLLGFFDPNRSAAPRWFTQVPLSLYFGWIIIATVANISAALVGLGWNRFNLS